MAAENPFHPSVSPWLKVLPAFEMRVSKTMFDGYVGLRDFVALACDAPALANRYVWPSTICMNIFRTHAPVSRADKFKPSHFAVGMSGRDQVKLAYFPAGASEPMRTWEVSPSLAITIIAMGFSVRDEGAESG